MIHKKGRRDFMLNLGAWPVCVALFHVYVCLCVLQLYAVVCACLCISYNTENVAGTRYINLERNLVTLLLI